MKTSLSFADLRSSPSRVRGRIPPLLRFGLSGILLVILIMLFANYPAGLPLWRFWCSTSSLVLLLLINALWMRPAAVPRIRFSLKALLSLVLSELLVFAATVLSGQLDIFYLVSLICGEATILLGAWPAGIAFGTVSIAAWLLLQIFSHAPMNAVAATGVALATGVVLVILFTRLIARYAFQTERSERLLSELRAANADLALAREREKELAVAEERVRLSRELHDSVTQLLYSSSLFAGAACDSIASGDIAAAAKNALEARDAAQRALREMRLLVFDLHSTLLTNDAFAEALQARLDAVETRGGIRAELHIEGADTLEPGERMELYGIAQEALNNALKHAAATAVSVSLSATNEEFVLEVADDGVGFDPAAGRAAGGMGMSGMEGRAKKIGGRLCVESAPGTGTKIVARIPREA